MCTVTYLPTPKGYIITSNRDEQNTRPSALHPQHYSLGGKLSIFPKDALAGGTWIGTMETGVTAVLLNGAFDPHIPSPPYAKSRGLVFLDLLQAPEPIRAFQEYNCNNIEPFTLILRGAFGLTECRWDGKEKYSTPLNINHTYIWSSATLYDTATIQTRQQWFDTWLSVHQTYTQPDILEFHCFSGDGDPYHDLMMNRNGAVYTVSVTSVEVDNEEACMQYYDLKANHKHQLNLPLILHPSSKTFI